MGLFGNKKMSAEELLKAFAELPEDEREAVKAMIVGEPEGEADAEAVAEPEAEEPADAPEGDAGEGAEEPSADAPAEEDGLPPLEADAEPAEDEADGTESEGAPEPELAVEQPPEAPAEEAPAEEKSAVDLSIVLARMEKLEETIAALAQRIGADEDAAGEDEDPFGLAFGAEHKSASEEDDLERAKREAGFNF